jgi:Glyoxalase superfamily protein/Clp amino terminal domain, pathogenicity island component
LSRSKAKDEDMRDFRNAKAMAQTLRAALATKGVEITIGQSLELIAEIFGLADWNTLAAAIRAETSISGEKVSPPQPAVGSSSFPPLSSALAATLHRAVGFASQRKHEYATLEHLLLALIDDADASTVMRVCGAGLGALADKLVGYLDNELMKIVIDNGTDPKPTAAFQRAVQRAEVRGKEMGRSMITGANILEAITSETQSLAARLLGEQGITRQHLLSIITHGTA